MVPAFSVLSRSSVYVVAQAGIIDLHAGYHVVPENSREANEASRSADWPRKVPTSACSGYWKASAYVKTTADRDARNVRVQRKLSRAEHTTPYFQTNSGGYTPAGRYIHVQLPVV